MRCVCGFPGRRRRRPPTAPAWALLLGRGLARDRIMNSECNQKLSALQEVLDRLYERDPDFAIEYLNGALAALLGVLRSKQLLPQFAARRLEFYEQHRRVPNASELFEIELQVRQELDP